VPFSYPADWLLKFKRIYLLLGNVMEGYHKFEIRLKALNTLARGKAKFDLMAATSWKDQFFMELLGKDTLALWMTVIS
jgi:hypothetical protein